MQYKHIGALFRASTCCPLEPYSELTPTVRWIYTQSCRLLNVSVFHFDNLFVLYLPRNYLYAIWLLLLPT